MATPASSQPTLSVPIVCTDNTSSTHSLAHSFIPAPLAPSSNSTLSSAATPSVIAAYTHPPKPFTASCGGPDLQIHVEPAECTDKGVGSDNQEVSIGGGQSNNGGCSDNESITHIERHTTRLCTEHRRCIVGIIIMIAISSLLIILLLLLSIVIPVAVLSSLTNSIISIGGNAIINAGCYTNAFYTSITIIGNIDYSGIVYVAPADPLDVQYIDVLLDNKSYVNSARYADTRISFNYYDGVSPVYTARDAGYLFFDMVARTELPTINDCQLELYLFNNEANYILFLQADPPSITGYVKSSGCFPVNEHVRSFSFNFSLPQSGLYYVGCAIKHGVIVNSTRYASVVLPNVTSLDPKCSINARDSQCLISIDYSNTCLFISSESSILHQLSLRKDWNIGIIIVIIIAALFIMIVLFMPLCLCFSICIAYFCYQRCI
jgi:hypothetical protein